MIVSSMFLVSSTPSEGRPLFAAGSGSNGSSSGPSSAPPPPPTGRVVPSSKNTKIMHPEEDISLEELKARKYQHLADRSGPVQFNFSTNKNQMDDTHQGPRDYGQPNSAISNAFGMFCK